jgi:hypothetical protein
VDLKGLDNGKDNFNLFGIGKLQDFVNKVLVHD